VSDDSEPCLIRTHGNCRADIGADVEFLSVVHKAGARLFCVGFESGDVEVINGMKKNSDDCRDAKYPDEASWRNSDHEFGSTKAVLVDFYDFDSDLKTRMVP